MTFFHLLSCLGLAYAPTVAVYKGLTAKKKTPQKNFEKRDDFFRLIFPLLFNFGKIQFCKYLLLIMVVSRSSPASFLTSFFVFFLRSCVDGFFDAYGIFRTLQVKELQQFNFIERIVASGICFSFGDSLVKYLFPLILEATQLDFSYRFVQMAILANVSLAYYWVGSLLIHHADHEIRRKKLWSIPDTWNVALLAHFIVIPFSLHMYNYLQGEPETAQDLVRGAGVNIFLSSLCLGCWSSFLPDLKLKDGS